MTKLLTTLEYLLSAFAGVVAQSKSKDTLCKIYQSEN